MSDTAGWDAIEAALARVHGDQEPAHFGTVMRYRDGGPDPLDGISAYRADCPPHWHFVTFGFSELFGKENDDPAVSGWGFELSFRLARAEHETEAPRWPLGFLQTLASYVFNTGRPFGHEHFIRWGDPVTRAAPTSLTALVFHADPELRWIATPNGRVEFLTPVGITADEHRFAEQSGPSALLALLLAGNPLGVTRLDRPELPLP